MRSGNWMPATTAAGKTTMTVTTLQPNTYPPNPSAPTARSRFASTAMRSPSANGIAIAAASSEQVSAKPARVAWRLPPQNAYAAPPRPMPRRAMARIRPNVKVEPPRSGASMRYQTSSMRRKAKPPTAAAAGMIVGRGGVAAALQIARDHADAHVPRHRHEQRPHVPQPLEQKERRQQRSRHRAERIRAVQQREAAAAGAVGRLHRARRGGERAAHQQRRHAEDQRRQDQPRHRRAEEAEDDRAAESEVDLRDEPQQQRRERRRRGDQQFQIAVKAERAGMAVGAPAEERAAEAEAAHEDRPDRGRRERRRAEDQAELAQPRRLVDERAEAGAEEQRSRQPPPYHS